MESVLVVKSIHVLTASITILLFILRYSWMILESDLLQKKWVKVVPHINDTLLLICAILLSIQIEQYPFIHPWLSVKVAMLLLYIFSGVIALRQGGSKRVRVSAGLFAIVVFSLIASIAVTKSPIGIFSLLG